MLAHVALGVAAPRPEGEQLHQLAGVVLVGLPLRAVPVEEEEHGRIAGHAAQEALERAERLAAEERVLASISLTSARRPSPWRTSRATRAPCARRAAGSSGPCGRATRGGRATTPRRRSGRPSTRGAGPRRRRDAGAGATAPRRRGPSSRRRSASPSGAEAGAPQQPLCLLPAEAAAIGRKGGHRRTSWAIGRRPCGAPSDAAPFAPAPCCNAGKGNPPHTGRRL